LDIGNVEDVVLVVGRIVVDSEREILAAATGKAGAVKVCVVQDNVGVGCN
jgi:hypothetical protein